MDYYTLLRQLAKSTKSQNLFFAAKEINGIKLFNNDYDFSRFQELYLSYLYFYESIMRDIIVEKISKHVLDNEIFEDSYALWKKEKKDKKKHQQKSDVNLVIGNKIKFPQRGK